MPEAGQGARRRGLGGFLLDLLFPPQCAGCGRRGSWLCPACLAALAPPPQRCLHCGRALPYPRRLPLCPACRRAGSPLSGLLAAHSFEGPLRAAIHALKYRRARHLAEPLAALFLPLALPPADLLVPVPLHASRLAERGYNQSALLAAEVARATGIEVDDGVICRTRPTPPQTGLSAGERRTNVAGAFAVAPGGGPRVVGRRILLLDDVCTTGSTLEAAAECLVAAGAAQVNGLVLARAV